LTVAPSDAHTGLRAADEVFVKRGLAERVERDRSLGALTTYRVGGVAARFLVAESIDDLVVVAEAIAAGSLPVLVVGRGSNLLVSDSGFPGVAVQLGSEFESIDVAGCRVEAGGAARLPLVARRSAKDGCTGFEWAVGVPGSVGGAVRMNAGGHGSDIAATLVSATVVDLGEGGAVRTIDARDLALSYRSSAVRDADVVASATFQLAPGDPDRALREIDEIVRWRRDNQPGGQNAGSVFTNPPGDSAGRLIDAAGCKGLRVGSAHVSPKHANFFQSDEGGSAEDVRALMREVQARVRAEFGIDLVPETRMIGFATDGTRPARGAGGPGASA
jgi:UDP-N-acetylmuramate dehydrogenase